MPANSNSKRLTAAEVLRRYKDKDLPAFCEITLEDVNQVGNFGERRLHVASSRGNMEEVAALVEAGAETNAPGDLGNTPLHEAVSQGHMWPSNICSITELLLMCKMSLGRRPWIRLDRQTATTSSELFNPEQSMID